MARRIEPRQVAMSYFATAPLEEARQVLADASAIVKARTGKPIARPKPRLAQDVARPQSVVAAATS